MSINTALIKSDLVRLIRDVIGDRLSTVKGPNDTQIPSVLKKRSGRNMPDFPYIMIDLVGVNKVGYGLRDEYINDDGYYVSEKDYIGNFIIEVYGGKDDDVNSIAVDLQSLLYSEVMSETICTQLTTSQILDTSDVNFFPSYLETDFQEMARFTIDLSITAIYIDNIQAETIDDVNVESNLYTDIDDKTNPRQTDITAP